MNFQGSKFPIRPLRIIFDNLEISPECAQNPSDLAEKGLDDDCFVRISVTDEDLMPSSWSPNRTHRLRFNRVFRNKKIDFELALMAGQIGNSESDIKWFYDHAKSGDTDTIHKIVRIMGNMLDVPGVNGNAKLPLVMANYIATGKVTFPRDEVEQEKALFDHKPWKSHSENELKASVLDVFSNSHPYLAGGFAQRIKAFSNDPQLSSQAKGRVQSLSQVYSYVGEYRSFLRALLQIQSPSKEQKEHSSYGHLQSFAAKVVLDAKEGAQFDFNSYSAQGFKAWREVLNHQKPEQEFCQSVRAASQQIKDRAPEWDLALTQECTKRKSIPFPDQL